MRDSKRCRDKEETFGPCGRRQGWDDLREQHWNMYITISEIDHQSRFNAWDRALRASALALSALSHASNLDWWSVSHTVIYMLQCYSLKSSQPHLLPQSPKVCSLHLWFFCCLAYRAIVTIFLNSIYYCTGVFSSWLTSLCIIGSSFIHVFRTDSNAFLLIAE